MAHDSSPQRSVGSQGSAGPIWPRPLATGPEPVPAGLLRALALALPLSLLLWGGVAAAAWHAAPRPIRHELHQDVAKLWHRAHKPKSHDTQPAPIKR